MENGMIQAQATAARIACTRMTVPDLTEHAADGIIVSSRRPLLAHLRAGDGDAAAVEMERHLRSLLYMRRVALPGRLAAVSEAAI
jgi:DNA-binding GntR family transcriptional regulator